MRVVYLGAVIIILTACSGEKVHNDQEHHTSEVKVISHPGTEKMVAMLERFSEDKDLSVSYYFNKARAESMKTKLDPANPGYSKQLFFYAIELLNAGESEESIRQIEQLISSLESRGMSVGKELKDLYEFRAIAYLRLAEQNNCISNHNEESCVFPIDGKGIHKQRYGSEKAIENYLEILNHHPEDLRSIWLLNLAYMTLGEYPDGVPAKFCIPPEKLQSTYPFPVFKNIAEPTNTGIWGLAGGCLVEDINNDGFLDIMASSWGLNKSDQLRYLQNTGLGDFVDKTEEAGLNGLIGGLNINHADYNNDGHQDILVLRGGWIKSNNQQPNSLLKNNGDGTFEDVTEESGLLSYHPTQTAAWADINLDGWLDLFIGNESTTGSTHLCELYMNNGDGTFTNIAAESKLDLEGYTKGVAWGDVNNDRYPDLYVSFLNRPNMLFLNKGTKAGNGWSFDDISKTAGVQLPVKSFPVWFFDYNQDGFDDIFISSYESFEGSFSGYVLADIMGQKHGHGAPKLYMNNGDNTFRDITKEAGLYSPLYTMGCNYGDLDNDGYPDIFLGTGQPDFRSIIPNKVYLNNNGKKFEDITSAGGFGSIQKGHGVGFGDLDNDGDQDVYMVLGGAFEGDIFQNALYLNPADDKQNWITVKLEGERSNKSALGARVKVTAEMKDGSDRNFYQTVTNGSSFGSNSLQLEIGLGSAVRIRELSVSWPHPEVPGQKFADVESRQKILIKEGDDRIHTLDQAVVSMKTDSEETDHTHMHH